MGWVAIHIVVLIVLSWWTLFQKMYHDIENKTITKYRYDSDGK